MSSLSPFILRSASPGSNPFRNPAARILGVVALGLVYGSVAVAAPPASADVPSPVFSRAGGDSLGSHPLCNTDLVLSRLARVSTSGPPVGFGDFALAAGIWVGAKFDRGGGLETAVSTSLWWAEFNAINPGSAAPVPRSLRRYAASADPFQLVHADTAQWPFPPPEPHVPLGIQVVQESFSVDDPDVGDFVKMKFTVKNISDVFQPPGWDLESLYFGIMADPDVGVADDDLRYWEDDQGAFVARGTNTGQGIPPGAKRGDLAYVFDEPGVQGDDVTTQVGLVTLGASAHVFRVWSGGAQDPTSDLQRYAMMRGVSDDFPTIDPPTTRSADQRILVTIGPVPLLAPGEVATFAVGVLCGELVPSVGPDPGPAGEPPAASSLAGVSVAPNPVRLAAVGATGGVTFRSLPARATVGIYSVAGKLVRRLEPGSAQASWDLRSEGGARVPGGVYFYRVSIPDADPRMGRLVVLR